MTSNPAIHGNKSRAASHTVPKCMIIIRIRRSRGEQPQLVYHLVHVAFIQRTELSIGQTLSVLGGFDIGSGAEQAQKSPLHSLLLPGQWNILHFDLSTAAKHPV
jgi:hypothetical protein